MEKDAHGLTLANLKQLEEARTNEEDWTGKRDSAERRKLQNRLHQRAWRRRKAAGLAPANPTVLTSAEPYLGISNGLTNATSAGIAETSAAYPLLEPSMTLHTAPAWVGLPNAAAMELSILKRGPLLKPGYQDSSQNTSATLLGARAAGVKVPHTSISIFRFPLTPDHYLITLIQYNVLRGIMSNLAACSLLRCIPESCGGAILKAIFPSPSALPPSFTPTSMQLSVPHNPWVDSIPCPNLRDNIIRAETSTSLDEDELCNDLCGGLYDGFDDCEQRGMLVWGEPWRIDSWEISPGLAQKWGWLFKGCEEMIESTNRWREQRGEERLVIEMH